MQVVCFFVFFKPDHQQVLIKGTVLVHLWKRCINEDNDTWLNDLCEEILSRTHGDQMSTVFRYCLWGLFLGQHGWLEFPELSNLLCDNATLSGVSDWNSSCRPERMFLIPASEEAAFPFVHCPSDFPDHCLWGLISSCCSAAGIYRDFLLFLTPPLLSEGNKCDEAVIMELPLHTYRGNCPEIPVAAGIPIWLSHVGSAHVHPHPPTYIYLQSVGGQTEATQTEVQSHRVKLEVSYFRNQSVNLRPLWRETTPRPTLVTKRGILFSALTPGERARWHGVVQS